MKARRSAAVLWAGFVFIGCGNEPPQPGASAAETAPAAESTPEPAPARDPASPAVPEHAPAARTDTTNRGDEGDAAGPVRRLPFSGDSVPAGVRVDGTLTGGLHFADANGDNWLVVTRKETHPVPDDPAWLSRFLTVRHVVNPAGKKPRELRVVRDKVEECLGRADLAVDGDDIVLSDLDGDGVAEVMFGYRMTCVPDGPKAIDYGYKLLLLEGGDKYIIRGKFRQTRETPVVLSKNVDKSVVKGPAVFRSQLESRWNAIAGDVFARARFADEFAPDRPGAARPGQ